MIVCCESEMFLVMKNFESKFMQYANVAEVLEPQGLREELRKVFKESVKKYKD